MAPSLRAAITRPLQLALPAVALAFAVAACAGAEAPVVSFDPAGPCTHDGQQPGAYPELEALLPTTWGEQGPSNVDSGRTCTPEALGTLATRGVEELRFAGATWETGGQSGFTVAVFEAPDLDAARMVEFYEAGVKAANQGGTHQLTEVTVGGKPGMRLDVLGTDGSGQTVIAWPSDAPDRVYALLVANMGEARTAELLEAFGDR